MPLMTNRLFIQMILSEGKNWKRECTTRKHHEAVKSKREFSMFPSNKLNLFMVTHKQINRGKFLAKSTTGKSSGSLIPIRIRTWYMALENWRRLNKKVVTIALLFWNRSYLFEKSYIIMLLLIWNFSVSICTSSTRRPPLRRSLFAI